MPPDLRKQTCAGRAITSRAWENGLEANDPSAVRQTPLVQGVDDHYRLRLRDRMSIVTSRHPERHLGDFCSCPPAVHWRIIRERTTTSERGRWNWKLKPTRDGYSVVSHKGTRWLAHRFVYEVIAGDIPDGLSLDHLCRNRACVNPLHLEPVTYEENFRRGAWVNRELATSVPPPIPRRPYRRRTEVIAPDDPRHGSTAGYTGLKCRCDRCRAAHAKAARENRRRKQAERPIRETGGTE